MNTIFHRFSRYRFPSCWVTIDWKNEKIYISRRRKKQIVCKLDEYNRFSGNFAKFVDRKCQN